jgi:hypothetical protein
MRRHSVAVGALAFCAVAAWNVLAGARRYAGARSQVAAAGACRVRGGGLFVLPDRRCTPGQADPRVTQARIGETICRAGWTERARPPEAVTEALKRRGVAAYGDYAGRRLGAYEEDHLIPLELGGAPVGATSAGGTRNLWPERDYVGVSPSSFYLNPKDHLEDRLRALVCAGRMTLATAQHLIATDWVSAYGRYVKASGS